ncbi:hypothetical protein BHE74_00029519 [Ensete ventricosum]|uniref:Uncharacterized protein n=1 Tax=Ensete ventricosum TaxID=4639 RepID=A0A427A028_ENSVE|nr:hypothetical protein B296_00030917 [Ensete ventricosum]RWW63305.1 hypothetical protein BHE74_00029519 [Ensete ventricosum]RZS08664.1 hypothetical protein BHM03_00039690 [Ensete ventricosum]
MPGKLLNTLVKLLVCRTAIQTLTPAPRCGSLRGPEEEETAGGSGSESVNLFLSNTFFCCVL